MVVFFTASRDDLARRFASLRTRSPPADGLWIAYPKKASKLDSDLNFESVQQVGLDNGLVDNKSCASTRLDGRALRVSPRARPS